MFPCLFSSSHDCRTIATYIAGMSQMAWGYLGYSSSLLHTLSCDAESRTEARMAAR
jgi:hypothetical protein